MRRSKNAFVFSDYRSKLKISLRSKSWSEFSEVAEIATAPATRDHFPHYLLYYSKCSYVLVRQQPGYGKLQHCHGSSIPERGQYEIVYPDANGVCGGFQVDIGPNEKLISKQHSSLAWQDCVSFQSLHLLYCNFLS